MAVALSFQRRGLPADIRARGAPQGYGVTKVSASFPRALTRPCNDGDILRLLPGDRLDHRKPAPAGPDATQVIFRLLETEGERYVAATTYMALPEVEHVRQTRPTVDMATFATPIDAIAGSATPGRAVQDHAVAFEQAIQSALTSGRPLSKERLELHPDLVAADAAARDARRLAQLAIGRSLTDALSARAPGERAAAQDSAPLLTFLDVTLRLFLQTHATTRASDDGPYATRAVAAYGDWTDDDRFVARFRPPSVMTAKSAAGPTSRLRSLFRGRPAPGAAPAYDPPEHSPAIAAFDIVSRHAWARPGTLEALRRAANSGVGPNAPPTPFVDAMIDAVSAGDDAHPWTSRFAALRGVREGSPPDDDESIAHAATAALARALLLTFDSADDDVIDPAIDRLNVLLGGLSRLENDYGWARPA